MLTDERDGGVINEASIRFTLATLPFLLVLIYFFYTAATRPYYYSQQIADDEEPLLCLMDILAVFLAFHVLWTLFLAYLVWYIPKRRRFLGRYLSEGETSLGDVVFDESSRRTIGKCCRLNYADYGFAVYPHPQKQQIVRKRVRVYQTYTRERVTILRLPDRPLSGQPKMEIEMDLSNMKRERDTTLRWMTIVSIFWFCFTLVGAVYTQIQMAKSIAQGFVVGNENDKVGRRILILVVGLNIPVALAVNFVRFLLWRNWMVNRGAVLENDADARHSSDPNCLFAAPSRDGSEDAIPYSIMAEEHSYTGTLPSHSSTLRNSRNAAAQNTNSSSLGRNVSKKPSTVHVPMASHQESPEEDASVAKNWTSV
ncbi:MAG: hypothetical protein SGILL_010468 [Bacillariaceae sp.]